MSPATLEHRGDRVTLAAAFGPGVKQLSYSYTLPPRAFPLTLTFEHATGVFEVLLEEPGAQVRAPLLRSMGEVTTQGREFKRFLAQGPAEGATVRIDVPTTSATTRTRVLVGVAIVIALAMVGALVRALRRRAPDAVTPSGGMDESAGTLARACGAQDTPVGRACRGERHSVDSRHNSTRTGTRKPVQCRRGPATVTGSCTRIPRNATDCGREGGAARPGARRRPRPRYVHRSSGEG